MTFPARLQITPAADRRASPRRKLSLDLSLRTSGEDVTVHDISPTGMLIQTGAELAPFDGLEIELPQVGITEGFVVWSSGRYFGCEFRERLPQAAVSAALLRSPAATPIDPAPSPAHGAAGSADDANIDEAGACFEAEEQKAPLGVRLRVILGSAIFLWALIIWTIASLVELFRRS